LSFWKCYSLKAVEESIYRWWWWGVLEEEKRRRIGKGKAAVFVVKEQETGLQESRVTPTFWRGRQFPRNE
jgi:hypothetical protein